MCTHVRAHTRILPQWHYTSFHCKLFSLKNAQPFFLTLHTIPTKVTDVYNLVRIFACLPPCLHNYTEHLYYVFWTYSFITVASSYTYYHILLFSLNNTPWKPPHSVKCCIKAHGLDGQFTEPSLLTNIPSISST